MTTHLSRVSTAGGMQPLICDICGPPGAGKTTFALGAPKPLLIPFEHGLGLQQVDAVPTPTSFAEVMGILSELVREDHSYRSLVIDACDGLEPIIFQEVAEENGKSHIEQIGYGKGYQFAAAKGRDFCDGLITLSRTKRMNIILISHVAARTIDDPVKGPFTRYELATHQKVLSPLILRFVDVLGYLDLERASVTKGQDGGRQVTTTRTTGERTLWLEDQGSLIAKNRYALPQSISPIGIDSGWKQLTTAIKASFDAINDQKEVA